MAESFNALYTVYYETLRFVAPEFGSITNQPPSPGANMPLGSALHVLQNATGVATGRFRVHASLALAWVHWALDHGLNPTPEIDQHRVAIRDYLLQEQVPLDLVTGATSGTEAYLVPLIALGCKLKNFWLRGRIHQGIDVTTVAAGIQVKRAVKDLQRVCDPRTWATTVPETFEKTFRCGPSPVDPTDEPANLDFEGPNPPLGEPWRDTLYEEAHWPVGLLQITACNLLNVDYRHLLTVDGKGRLFLKYSMNECLTTEVSALGGAMTGFGGIDRDSGFVDVRGMKDDFASVSGKKSLRFVPGLDEQFFLNDQTAAILTLWITLTIIGGACYDFHPELT